MANIPSPHSFIFTDEYICLWENCRRNFDDAEMLYEHLRDDHVGRKANHNLCLTCKWDNCTVPTFAKRDHITSHLRVHVPSKPYHCEVCRKGFKRPQDLKKHEKIHQDDKDQIVNSSAAGTAAASAAVRPVAGIAASSSHLQPHTDQNYQPLTPPTHLDRSPSVAASTLSSHSPYSMPLSPASIADSVDNWLPELASPSYSTNSDLYSSPSAPDLELDILTPTYGSHNSNGGRPTIDISGQYYGIGAMPYDDMISPLSAKRPRDGFDEVLSDTLGSFAMEAKKKKMNPSYNDEEMVGRLNALSALLEVNPLTPDRLLNSLPDVTDWNQFSQFNQFCSALFEDVSGEVFEPQSFDQPLFPDYEQKQNPLVLDGDLGLQGGAYPNFAATGLQGANHLGNLAAAPTTVSSDAAMYQAVLGDDPFGSSATSISTTTFDALAAGASILPWSTVPTSGASMVTPSPNAAVGVNSRPVARSALQAPINQSRYAAYLTSVTNSPSIVSFSGIKQEPEDIKPSALVEPSVLVKQEPRNFAEASTQTRERQEAAAQGLLMLRKPEQQKKKKRDKARESVEEYEEEDPEILLMRAPAVPTTPMPTIEIELSDEEEAETTEATEGQQQEQLAGEVDIASTSSSRFGDIMKRALESQARTAAAAAAAAQQQQEQQQRQQEPLDPVEAMTQQLASTHLEATVARGPSTRPIVEGDMDRQMKAARARSLCETDPLRKQHADTVLTLLRSIDSLMAEHKLKVAQYRMVQQQHGHGSGAATPRLARSASPTVTASRTAGYPRSGNLNVQNHQGPIRTVSSYLPRRTGVPAGSTAPLHPSPLQQESSVVETDYHQLRSSFMSEGGSSSGGPSAHTAASVSSTGANTIASGISSPSSLSSSSASSALYPTSDLHHSSVPFELSEEERRFIEEDNAKTAAAQAAAAGYHHSIHV